MNIKTTFNHRLFFKHTTPKKCLSATLLYDTDLYCGTFFFMLFFIVLFKVVLPIFLSTDITLFVLQNLVDKNIELNYLNKKNHLNWCILSMLYYEIKNIIQMFQTHLVYDVIRLELIYLIYRINNCYKVRSNEYRFSCLISGICFSENIQSTFCFVFDFPLYNGNSKIVTVWNILQ